MTKEEREILIETGMTNKHGVCFGDFYYFNYYGINVFFRVCKTTDMQVCLYEIEKKKVTVVGESELKECIHYDVKPARHPLVITENNTSRNSQYWVFSCEDKSVSLYIDSSYPIYKLAKELGLNPEEGFLNAISLAGIQPNGVCNYYWDINVKEPDRKKIKKENKLKKDIDKVYYID